MFHDGSIIAVNNNFHHDIVDGKYVARAYDNAEDMKTNGIKKR